jgi:glutathione S-transferase
MLTPDLVLYHSPGACSLVSRIALEEAGLPHRVELVNFAAGDQSKPDYAMLSPLGKVPALLVDGAALIENAAIIVYVAALRPTAGLFPASRDPLVVAEAQGGLSFCGGTLHPIVRGLINPIRVTTGDAEGVRERSTELAIKSFGYAERRLAERGWWLGSWSIVDVYLDWAWSVAIRGGFDGHGLPLLTRLHSRLLERPVFARVMELEAQARKRLGS